jgi:nickel transport protein
VNGLQQLCGGVVLALSSPVLVLAHDLEVTLEMRAPVVIARATYAGRDPASYAKVTVHSPRSPGTPYQSGNADLNGSFAFVPDGPGTWRISIDDELGHLKSATVEVAGEFDAARSVTSSGLSRLERALIGAALIIGLTGFYYGYRSRRVARP